MQKYSLVVGGMLVPPLYCMSDQVSKGLTHSNAA